MTRNLSINAIADILAADNDSENESIRIYGQNINMCDDEDSSDCENSLNEDSDSDEQLSGDTEEGSSCSSCAKCSKLIC